jgi:indole-3-glycerol phosphate synthase
MSGLLTEMTQTSLARLEAARGRESEQALWNRVVDMPPAPRLTLSSEGFDLIAECKLHSPSAGDLSANTTDVESRVAAYGLGGAAAVSVLTEPKRFGGSLDHLSQAVRVLTPLNVPVMRKDFLVDPYQVMEGRAAGAGGVLVIVRMLDPGRITAMLDCAAMLKMFVLIEAFDAADLTVTKEILKHRQGREEQLLVGVNCRDLEKLSVDLARLGEVADLLPEEYPKVAESGVANVDDVRRVVDLGYTMALVGSSLMNSDRPRELASELLVAGRERALARHAAGA